MKTRHGVVVLTLAASLALTVPALSAGKEQAAQRQTSNKTQAKTKQQLKAGAGTQLGTMGTKTQSVKTYGPGDGTGN